MYQIKCSLLLFFLMGVGVLYSTSLQAQQLSKEEEKKYKKLAKEYKKNPGSLKRLIEREETAREELREMEQKMSVIESGNDRKVARIEELESEVARLNNQLAANKNKLDNLKNRPAPASEEQGDWGQGVMYRVQIGAYQKNTMDGELDTEDPGMDLEYDEGLQKIVLARFRDFTKAEALQKYLQRIGVSDAFIAAYRDGNRIPLEEVQP